jgi:hypothetical protein
MTPRATRRIAPAFASQIEGDAANESEPVDRRGLSNRSKKVVAVPRDFGAANTTNKLLPWKLEKWVPYGCFIQESPVRAGLSNRSGKEDQSMIQLLIKAVHPLFGRITVRFLWKRKPHK